MADGLFFTGTVFKNNRNLIQEENARQQLAIQEEQLNMKKQEAAERRAKARKDELKGYKVESDISQYGDPRFKKIMIDQAAKVNKFVSDNADNISDPDIQIQLQQMKDSTILLGGYLSQLDSKLTVLDPTNDASKNIRFKSDEEGNSLFETNLNNVVSSLNDGTFDLNARISSFAEDFDGSIIKDKPSSSYNEIFDGLQTTYVDQTTGETKKGLPPGSESVFNNSFRNQHMINASTGDFSGISQEDTYFNETFDVDGALLTGIQKYLMDEEGMTGVEGTKKAMIDRFDPKSELFDEALHVKYVDYLAKEIYKKESKARMQIISKVKRDDGKATGYTEEMKAMVSVESDPHETEVYGDVTLKDKVFTGIKEVKVNITPDMMLEGQGDDAKNELVKTHKSEVISGGEYDPKRPMPGSVIGVGHTMDGTPAAKVKAFNQVFLVPLELLYTEIKDANVVEKGGLGQAILESASGGKVAETEATTTTPTKAPR